jgi:hypothetical protein
MGLRRMQGRQRGRHPYRRQVRSGLMAMTEAGADDAFYEWLLSDHPDARAERDRRREATYQDERERTGKVLAWVGKIDATPDAPQALRDLARTMGPLATKAAARAEADFAEPDDAHVARARANFETYMQVSAPHSSWDYRYPARYIGPEAGSQAAPAFEPEPEAARDEPEIST